MSEEVKEEETKVVRRRGRKPKYLEEPKKVTGVIDGNEFLRATVDIEKESLVRTDMVKDILIKSMEQAYLEWSYPGLFRDRDNPDPAKSLIQCRIDFVEDEKAPTHSSFKIYDIKTVTEEDEIIDDAYQISPEDAMEYKENPQIGDTVEIPFDVTKLDKSYVRRVKQLFQSHLKDASRTAILNVYSDRIGQLIEGTVVRFDAIGNSYEINFGKAEGFLRRQGVLPQDRFATGDRVLVYLSDVSEKSNPPSLVISRTDERFVRRLMERAIPELTTGEIAIRKIAREAGRRTKVFVESNNPNVDPIGTCLGIESNRIRSVINEIRGEKIDVLQYHHNKALQIVEAMKPAQVIGLSCPEDFFDPNVDIKELEKSADYEFSHIVAVVQNGNQGVAIGTAGVNVRLASQITNCTISVYQADQAITEGLKYSSLADIEQQAAAWEKARHPETVAPVTEKVEETTEEKTEPETVSEEKETMETPVETKEVAAETTAPVEEKTEEEKTAPVVQEPSSSPSTTSEIKEKPIEHVEIRNKPKISLEELEEALSQKKGPSETRSYRKRFDRNKNEKDSHVEEPSKASTATAMPIYTEEELKALEEQDQYGSQSDYETYDEDLDEQYDYYDDDDRKRN